MTREEADRQFEELSPQYIAATNAHDSAEVRRIGLLIMQLDNEVED